MNAFRQSTVRYDGNDYEMKSDTISHNPSHASFVRSYIYEAPLSRDTTSSFSAALSAPRNFSVILLIRVSIGTRIVRERETERSGLRGCRSHKSSRTSTHTHKK